MRCSTAICSGVAHAPVALFAIGRVAPILRGAAGIEIAALDRSVAQGKTSGDHEHLDILQPRRLVDEQIVPPPAAVPLGRGPLQAVEQMQPALVFGEPGAELRPRPQQCFMRDFDGLRARRIAIAHEQPGIDKAAAENQLRVVAVGRKNWLFAGSLECARRAALLYSLVQSCKLGGVEPFAYPEGRPAARRHAPAVTASPSSPPKAGRRPSVTASPRNAGSTPSVTRRSRHIKTASAQRLPLDGI